MQIEEPRQRVLHSLRMQGLTLVEVSPTNGGNNSSVFQCHSDQGYMQCLKFYKTPTLFDARKRLKNDINFLIYCRENRINNVPDLFQYSNENHWTLTEWIKGDCPTYLNSSMVIQIVDFLLETNLHENFEMSKRFSEASEALLSVQSLFSDVYARIGRLLTKKLDTKLDHEVHNWIMSDVVQLARSCYLNLSENRSNFTCLSNIFTTPILSQSDVGIHNLISSENKIYFYDFEYSGIDDISKWICDWVCQPNHEDFSDELKANLISLVRASDLKLDLYWEQRVEILLPVFRLKWILIMLNSFLSSEFDNTRFSYIKSYIAN